MEIQKPTEGATQHNHEGCTHNLFRSANQPRANTVVVTVKCRTLTDPKVNGISNPSDFRSKGPLVDVGNTVLILVTKPINAKLNLNFHLLRPFSLQSSVKPPRASLVAVSVHHNAISASIVYGIRNSAEFACNGLFIESSVDKTESVIVSRKLNLERHVFS